MGKLSGLTVPRVVRPSKGEKSTITESGRDTVNVGSRRASDPSDCLSQRRSLVRDRFLSATGPWTLRRAIESGLVHLRREFNLERLFFDWNGSADGPSARMEIQKRSTQEAFTPCSRFAHSDAYWSSKLSRVPQRGAGFPERIRQYRFSIFSSFCSDQSTCSLSPHWTIIDRHGALGKSSRLCSSAPNTTTQRLELCRAMVLVDIDAERCTPRNQDRQSERQHLSKSNDLGRVDIQTLFNISYL